MGNVISDSTLPASQLHGKERFAYEQVRMMEKMASLQLDKHENSVRSMSQLDAGNNKIRFERSIRIDASAESHCVDKVVEEFFTDSQTAPSILDSYKAVVKGGLRQVLEDETQGEVTDEKFFLCAKHNSLVRIDLFAYRFNFPTESLAFCHRNVVAYLLCERVIDAQHATTSEIMSQITECSKDAADGSLRDTYMDAMVAAWKRQRTSGLAPALGSAKQNPMVASIRSMMN
ncbi:uncharacterized protein B0I36DRAFT_365389 [Microdochium trichocladiopsis]|uniref:Uncharacterized protein n=1 Tax=Microdochium trichocladiopsis TaxID=1682393 RepID=A0A9P8XZG2_9PEZI|nr:uncharacterized protein B0I36DRAFT_365389 [Microdochium trichocladiopsis]KAH7025715.1 hypothetical protein B0I36DRAFT_365389 [Microdochium trichocladiopsis]